MGIRKLKKALGIRPGLNPRPSLNDLDEKLEKYLSFKSGFFIEAGANDGHTQSNTYYLEKTLDWNGLLVEGMSLPPSSNQ